jgi:ankyrin repeat protein
MGSLHVAAFSGCADCIAALVTVGAKIHYKVPTYREENALMMAIRSQQVAAAQKLLELGADPCQTDREGYDAQGWVKFYSLQSSFGFVPACHK